MNEISEDTIEKIKKFLAVIAALGAWLISMVFSNKGFDFQVHNMIWAGWVLSFIITVIELVFNSQLKYGSKNYSIYVLGFLSYTYDVGTNLVGLWISGGNAMMTAEGITDNFIGFLIYIFIAGLLAVAPEMLLVYGLIGISGSGEGDILRNVLQIREKGHVSMSSEPMEPMRVNHPPFPKSSGTPPMGRTYRQQQQRSSIPELDMNDEPMEPNYHPLNGNHR